MVPGTVLLHDFDAGYMKIMQSTGPYRLFQSPFPIASCNRLVKSVYEIASGNSIYRIDLQNRFLKSISYSDFVSRFGTSIEIQMVPGTFVLHDFDAGYMKIMQPTGQYPLIIALRNRLMKSVHEIASGNSISIIDLGNRFLTSIS